MSGALAKATRKPLRQALARTQNCNRFGQRSLRSLPIARCLGWFTGSIGKSLPVLIGDRAYTEWPASEATSNVQAEPELLVQRDLCIFVESLSSSIQLTVTPATICRHGIEPAHDSACAGIGHQNPDQAQAPNQNSRFRMSAKPQPRQGIGYCTPTSAMTAGPAIRGWRYPWQPVCPPTPATLCLY